MNKQDKRKNDLYGTPHRKFDNNNLDDILKNHKLWLDSNGENGKRANLYLADLSNKDFNNVDFRKAILHGAKFDNSDLIGADFREAHLSPANTDTKAEIKTSFKFTKSISAKFQNAVMNKCEFNHANLYTANFRNAVLEMANFDNADLTETSFIETVLKDVKLENTKGLSAENIAGSDVTNTELPPPFLDFNTINNVAESSKSKKKLFSMIIIACLYSIIAIATTSDEAILLNTTNLKLPLIGSSIPTVWFYLFTPVLLAILHLYFLLNLQRHWELISDLPAIFPNGNSLDKQIYPWFFNHIVLSNSKLISYKSPIFSKLQNLIIVFLTWFFIPIIIILFSLKYFKRADIIGMILIYCFCAASVIISTLSYMSSKMAFNHEKRMKARDFFSKKPSFVTVFIIILISIMALPIIFSSTLRKHNPYFKVNLANAKMEWVDLSNKNLQGAILKGANLHGANLENTNLKYADLRGANLKSVNFKKAVLDSAHLNETILINADLENTSLIGADLTMANIENINSKNANFQWAKLYFLKNEPDKFREKSRNTILAFREEREVVVGGEISVHNVCLTRKDLSYYDLQAANLFGANLRNFNLQNANFRLVVLDSANIIGADLTGARYLTENQLKHAIIDSTTRLPDYLNKQSDSQ